MKGPSDAAKAILDQLSARSSPWSKMTKKAPDRAQLLYELAELSEPAIVPRIFWLVISGPGAAARAAAHAVHSLMQDVPSKTLLQLDIAMREHTGAIWAVDSGYPYAVVDRSSIKELACYGEWSTALLGIGSFAADGYAREAAIQELAKVRTGEELPFLLIRLNDWVPQVCVAAGRAVYERLVPDNARAFVVCLPLVLRLNRCDRHDHTQLISRVEELLKSAECRSALADGVSSNHPSVRRACVELLFGIEDLDVVEWTGRLQRDRDPMVRFIVVKKVRDRLQGEELRQAFELLKGDRFVRVRREIYEAYADAFGPASCESELRTALFDRHRAMREVARYYIKKVEGEQVDLAQPYRDELSGTPGERLLGSILGLGETGHADDAKLIAPFVSHERIRIQRAAVRALAKLAPEEHATLFEELLLDGTPGVSRDARDAMIPQLFRYKLDKLWGSFLAATTPHLKRNLLVLFDSLDKWDRFVLLLRVVDQGDEEQQAHAIERLGRWLAAFNRSYASPTAQQASEGKEVLARLEQKLAGRRLWDELNFCLVGFS